MDEADRDGRRGQLETLIQDGEAVAQELRWKENRRQQTGVYERYERLVLRQAAVAEREELERHVARLATALKHRQKIDEVRSAREDVQSWLDFYWRHEIDGPQRDLEARRGAEIERLSALPSVHGKKARNIRWAARDKTKAYVCQRWVARRWKSKAVFARIVASDARKFGKSVGFQFAASNAERTIVQWISSSDNAPPTP